MICNEQKWEQLLDSKGEIESEVFPFNIAFIYQEMIQYTKQNDTDREISAIAVNTLPPIEKILEIVVYKQLLLHVEKNDIMIVTEYLNGNKLKLNVFKTKAIILTTKISKNLSMESKIIVYQTIILPHFDYCPSLLYQFNLNKMSQLQKFQNRGMRIVLGCNRYTPISFMLSALKWLTVFWDQVLSLVSGIFLLNDTIKMHRRVHVTNRPTAGKTYSGAPITLASSMTSIYSGGVTLLFTELIYVGRDSRSPVEPLSSGGRYSRPPFE
ncbi:hypothetical protein NQ317_013408 [Molorchus minor]|uniref:Uncharacterized protein n=1 Tax=Molorchus minor TaxID=1323400 RepID=A0ABQ9JC48_9CUCU|nr:hypothetical protein NQ317_013408 [Molorchus minor]